jgi:hypothetical protein
VPGKLHVQEGSRMLAGVATLGTIFMRKVGQFMFQLFLQFILPSFCPEALHAEVQYSMVAM